jgi:hypothetical protein
MFEVMLDGGFNSSRLLLLVIGLNNNCFVSVVHSRFHRIVSSCGVLK